MGPDRKLRFLQHSPALDEAGLALANSPLSGVDRFLMRLGFSRLFRTLAPVSLATTAGLVADVAYAQTAPAPGDLALSGNAVLTGPNCQFVLGFKTIHDAMPNIVGDCGDNEHFNPQNGNIEQHTIQHRPDGSTNVGMLTWRKADNWTAFTDGYRTWINGPSGIQERLNTDRFPWENDNTSSNTSPVNSQPNNPTPAPPNFVPIPNPTIDSVVDNPNVSYPDWSPSEANILRGFERDFLVRAMSVSIDSSDITDPSFLNSLSQVNRNILFPAINNMDSPLLAASKISTVKKDTTSALGHVTGSDLGTFAISPKFITGQALDNPQRSYAYAVFTWYKETMTLALDRKNVPPDLAEKGGLYIEGVFIKKAGGGLLPQSEIDWYSGTAITFAIQKEA